MKLVFIASWLRTQHYNIKESEKKLIGLKSGECVRVVQHIFLRLLFILLIFLTLFWVRVHELRLMDRFNII